MSQWAHPAGSKHGPLAGIRVLDLSRVLAGPYCSMLLGDLGAEVIKIERPGSGDDTRHWGPPFRNGESAYFICCNRNKKSVTLDLKTEIGRRLVRDLLRKSDVLVENFLPGKLAACGLDYQSVRVLNQSLVYCSITGFGQTGPRRLEPGYDLLVQAMSGVMSITGEPGRQPMKVGVAIADITAGLFASNAIMAALVGRATSGRGDYIDIALYDACLAWLANVGSAYLMTGELPARYGNAHPSIVPYQAFDALDAAFVVAVGNDRQYQRFCDAIGRPELGADARFSSNAARVRNREVLIGQLGEHFRAAEAAFWLEALARARVPCGPINTLDRALADPQVAARGMQVEVAHARCDSLSMVASPIKLASTGSTQGVSPPPLLGEHTEQILKSVLDLSDAEVAQLARDGIT